MQTVQLQPAYVLHARPFRESSQLLELLTRDLGRVGAVARGARGAKSRWRGILQPFRPLLVSFRRRSDLATLTAADAADTDAWWDGRPFDRILLDAPCSATGVIRRHPEIKWLRTPAQVKEVQRVQSRLLERLWPLLRHGGILVYATCSVLRRENNETIQAFLAAHDDATCTGPTRFGHAVEPGRQLLPGDDRGDGFYYAVLRRSGP